MKKTLNWLPMLTLLFLSCVRSPYPVPVGDDRSIRFPDFHDQFAVQVGESSSPYQLDGVMLRALMIAANDYIPPGTQEQDCLDRQEAQLYRVIRQGGIIFVSVSFNSAFCRPRAYPLDGGARYAISTDGRILRRLVGIEPDGFPREEPPGEGLPVPNHLVGASYEEIRAYWQDAGVPDSNVGGAQIPFAGPSPYLPLSWQDAGPRPLPSTPPSEMKDGGSLPLDGSSPIPDSGVPGGGQDGGM